MVKPKVRLGQVGEFSCYGVLAHDIWVPCGTWDEAMGWANYLAKVDQEAQERRRVATSGPGHWVVVRKTRRGSMYMRRMPNGRLRWTENIRMAYGYDTVSDAGIVSAGVSRDTGDHTFVVRRVEKVAMTCPECGNDLSTTNHKMDCSQRGR